jgi:hypothetical protein
MVRVEDPVELVDAKLGEMVQDTSSSEFDCQGVALAYQDIDIDQVLEAMKAREDFGEV